MKNAIEFAVSATGTSIAAIGTAVQTNESLQTIQLIVTICAAAVTFLTGIVGLVVRIISWYKKAKSDGKIDESEWEELGGIVKEGINDGKQAIDDINKQIKKKGETK